MITIRIQDSTGLSDADKLALQKAQEILDKILPSNVFGSRVLATTFRETGGLSNEQILAKIREDYSVRVRLFSSWKWWSKVVAYVNGKGGDTIHYSRKFWSVNNPVEIASTILHETSHLKGFTHYNKPWGTTIPYQMNRILEESAASMKL